MRSGDWRRFVTENADLCTRCGGLCCRSHPGMYLDPGQFLEAWGIKPEVGALRELFKRVPLKMKVCMGVPIPRPRNSEKGCVFLGEGGCTLPREKRPLGCLALIPREETILEGEIRCQIPRDLEYVQCFQGWKDFYESNGLWEDAWKLVKEKGGGLDEQSDKIAEPWSSKSS